MIFMFAQQIRSHVIVPALENIGMLTPAAEILVYGTGMVESNYQDIVQYGMPKNGGLGFWQDEPSDYFDLCIWLKNGFNKGLLEKVLNSCELTGLPKDPTILVYNLRLAALFCRIHYYRIRAPLPSMSDAYGLAEYHKEHYNSGGKADVDRNASIFKKIIDNEIK